MSTAPCTFSMIDGRLHARVADDEPVAVSLRYLRPLTERRHVAVIDDDGKEVALIDDLQRLAPACRELAEAALSDRYRMPVIERITAIDLRFGTLYWTVETNLGPHTFALTEPTRNVTWLDSARLIIRDTMGNRFTITDVGGLDAASLKLFKSVI